MTKTHILLVAQLFILCMSFCSVRAMTYDNRFFPFGPGMRIARKSTTVTPRAFVILANSSRNKLGNECGLFQLFGQYDLRDVGYALEQIGKPNPLKSEWRAARIPFRIGGTLRAEGCSLLYHQNLSNHLSLLANGGLMHVSTRPDFVLDEEHLESYLNNTVDENELQQIRVQMHRELGIVGETWSNVGPTDLDVALRLGSRTEYAYKCRSIDGGVSIGCLMPAGTKRDINTIVSIPFGGNHHWGLYGAGDVAFEVKEDITFGIQARVAKRFSRLMADRVPVVPAPDFEPTYVGAVVGDFKIRPGISYVVSPYLLFEDVREGFGFCLEYLMVHQAATKWFDRRVDKTVPAQLGVMKGLSSWTSETFSLNLLYDFAQRTFSEQSDFSVALIGAWDIPVNWAFARKVSQSHRISLGVEVRF